MIVLVGMLRCRNAEEADRVSALLPDHVALTRAEPGCLHFAVDPLDDGLCWAVSERFADRAAFEAHQARVAASAWGRGTAGIPREYTVTETPPPDTG